MSKYEQLCGAVGISKAGINQALCVYGYGNNYRACFSEYKTADTCIGCKANLTPSYPNFTAEKQLRLVQLIVIKDSITLFNDLNGWSFTVSTRDVVGLGDTFSEALASLTLQLIDSYKLYREEVKRILE